MFAANKKRKLVATPLRGNCDKPGNESNDNKEYNEEWCHFIKNVDDDDNDVGNDDDDDYNAATVLV